MLSQSSQSCESGGSEGGMDNSAVYGEVYGAVHGGVCDMDSAVCTCAVHIHYTSVV